MKHPRSWHPHENWYRDLILVAIVALNVWTAARLLHTQDILRTQARRVISTQKQIADGRRLALGATCAIESSIAQAGYNVILGSGHPPGTKRFVQNLRALGYVPLTRTQARQAATAYRLAIAQSVEHQIGRQGAGLVRHNGTVNCNVFRQIAKSG